MIEYSILANITLILFLAISYLRNKMLRREVVVLREKVAIINKLNRATVEANRVRDESVQIIKHPAAAERDAFEHEMYGE